MKKLMTFLLFTLFCCCSFTSVGQESGFFPTDKYPEFGGSLLTIALAYDKFIESGNPKDSIDLVNKVEGEKSFIGISGNSICNYEIGVVIKSSNFKAIPEDIFSQRADYDLRSYNLTLGNVNLEQLKRLNNIDEISRVRGSYLFDEELDTALPICNIDKVCGMQSIMERR